MSKRTKGFEVKYNEVANPHLLQEIIIDGDGSLVSQRFVCKKCKQPVIEIIDCGFLCLRHGCLEYNSG